jgi:hypothetical protein
MKTIVALQAWNNFSEYYSNQIKRIIAPEFEMTVTYNQDPDYLNQFDIVWSFFPQFPKVGVSMDKVVKTFWEPHEIEMGWQRGKVNVASCLYAYRRLLKGTPDALYAPLGVNIDHFYPKEVNNKRVVVGWCGEAANRRKHFPQLEAVMNEISEIDFRPNITVNKGGYLLGKYLKTEDMVEYYNSIDIYVCSSAGEGFGLPLLEASACGRPIVTFDVGIARELKYEGAGVIIVDGFIELKEAVTKLAKDRERIKILGEKSYKTVLQNWQWKHCTNHWLKVFRSI